jgi:hypothetical protein
MDERTAADMLELLITVRIGTSMSFAAGRPPRSPVMPRSKQPVR